MIVGGVPHKLSQYWSCKGRLIGLWWAVCHTKPWRYYEAIFIDGVNVFLADRGERTLYMSSFANGLPTRKAWDVVMKQIDAGFPIPYVVIAISQPAPRYSPVYGIKSVPG